MSSIYTIKGGNSTLNSHNSCAVGSSYTEFPLLGSSHNCGNNITGNIEKRGEELYIDIDNIRDFCDRGNKENGLGSPLPNYGNFTIHPITGGRK
jgi:hypothetical protein